MIQAGDLKKGVTLKMNNSLYRVVNTVYNNPGRGAASMRATLLDLGTWQTSQRVFSAGERLDNIFVETEKVQYLYHDPDTLYFMNLQTYDQYEASASLFGDEALYLLENMELELRLYDGRVIDYTLPTTVTHRIVESEVAVAGDTAGNVSKKVTTETGLIVSVPLFINVGDSVRIDTRDGSYVGRG
jgi:elongation factor P